jgi:quinol-cytochrome oxidoreductase complex cytochrome b subunit
VTLYEAITFFVFLFFYPLADQDSAYANTDFAIATMRLYTVMFIILCIMLALALNKSRKDSRMTG